PYGVNASTKMDDCGSLTSRNALPLTLVDDLFELLAGSKAHGLGRRDLDHLVGLGVSALSRLALRDAERAEPDERHALALPEAVRDSAEHRVDRAVGLRLADSGVSGHPVDQIALVHPSSGVELVLGLEGEAGPGRPAAVIAFAWKGVNLEGLSAGPF